MLAGTGLGTDHMRPHFDVEVDRVQTFLELDVESVHFLEELIQYAHDVVLNVRV